MQRHHAEFHPFPVTSLKAGKFPLVHSKAKFEFISAFGVIREQTTAAVINCKPRVEDKK